MAAEGACVFQTRGAGATLQGIVTKKRLGDDFREAVQAYIEGHATTCPVEPQFPAIWPKVARPDDGPEKQERARQFIAKLEHLKCDKIQMSPSACFGCEHNPRDGEKRAKNTKLMETYGHDLQHIERLHDASRMGLLRLSDVTIGEFDGMRRFWWAIERQRQHAQGF